LVDGEKADLLVHNLNGKQYADSFLALSNEFSGPITDVYATKRLR
jgi:hypothetical protein